MRSIAGCESVTNEFSQAFDKATRQFVVCLFQRMTRFCFRFWFIIVIRYLVARFLHYVCLQIRDWEMQLTVSGKMGHRKFGERGQSITDD
jgi:hypothetical protein